MTLLDMMTDVCFFFVFDHQNLMSCESRAYLQNTWLCCVYFSHDKLHSVYDKHIQCKWSKHRALFIKLSMTGCIRNEWNFRNNPKFLFRPVLGLINKDSDWAKESNGQMTRKGINNKKSSSSSPFTLQFVIHIHEGFESIEDNGRITLNVILSHFKCEHPLIDIFDDVSSHPTQVFPSQWNNLFRRIYLVIIRYLVNFSKIVLRSKIESASWRLKIQLMNEGNCWVSLICYLISFVITEYYFRAPDGRDIVVDTCPKRSTRQPRWKLISG